MALLNILSVWLCVTVRAHSMMQSIELPNQQCGNEAEMPCSRRSCFTNATWSTSGPRAPRPPLLPPPCLHPSGEMKSGQPTHAGLASFTLPLVDPWPYSTNSANRTELSERGSVTVAPSTYNSSAPICRTSRRSMNHECQSI